MIETPHHAQYYNLFREDAAGAVLWSQRLHHAVRAMHELLVYLDRLSLSDDEDQKEFASSVQADLFYDADFIEMLPKIAKGCVAQCRHFFRSDTHFTTPSIDCHRWHRAHHQDCYRWHRIAPTPPLLPPLTHPTIITAVGTTTHPPRHHCNR
jgi:hypothetical protein